MRKIYSHLFLLSLCLPLSLTLNAQSTNLSWAVKTGAYTSNQANGVAVDRSGNVYTTGSYSGTTDFDPGTGTYNLSSWGPGTDIYVQKLDASGHLLWAKSMGGPADDIGYALAIDADGSVLVTGIYTDSAKFNTGADSAMLYSHGDIDIFIVKLDSSGNYQWAKGIGSREVDLSKALALDAQGSVYITGGFSDTMDMDPGAGVYNVSAVSNYDIFVEKLDRNGNFNWGMSAGSVEDNETGMSLAVDASYNTYVTGFFMDTVDFDPGSAVHSLESAGNEDIFILKLDSSGHFAWVKGYGSSGSDHGTALSLTGSGHLIVTGNFANTVVFGTDTLTSDGPEDAFVADMDTSGHIHRVQRIGGSGAEGGACISTDASGNTYLAGVFSDTLDANPGTGVYDLTSVSTGYYNSFVVKLDPAGNFGGAGSISCSGISAINGIATDPAGQIYLAGGFLGTADFDPGMGTDYITTDSSFINSFVAKWAQLPTGISGVSNTCNIKLYPNPGKGKYRIDPGTVFGKSHIKITTMTGQVIYDMMHESAKAININLDVDAGLYFVVVTDETGNSYIARLINE